VLKKIEYALISSTLGDIFWVQLAARGKMESTREGPTIARKVHLAIPLPPGIASSLPTACSGRQNRTVAAHRSPCSPKLRRLPPVHPSGTRGGRRPWRSCWRRPSLGTRRGGAPATSRHSPRSSCSRRPSNRGSRRPPSPRGAPAPWPHSAVLPLQADREGRRHSAASQPSPSRVQVHAPSIDCRDTGVERALIAFIKRNLGLFL
jgi:hypothetical protein